MPPWLRWNSLRAHLVSQYQTFFKSLPLSHKSLLWHILHVPNSNTRYFWILNTISGGIYGRSSLSRNIFVSQIRPRISGTKNGPSIFVFLFWIPFFTKCYKLHCWHCFILHFRMLMWSIMFWSTFFRTIPWTHKLARPISCFACMTNANLKH
jgi:hypothetical protein